jgi:hypothetical protein
LYSQKCRCKDTKKIRIKEQEIRIISKKASNLLLLSLLFLTFVSSIKINVHMKATEQTLQEVERAIRKVAEKFPPSEEATLLTDIHLRVSQDSGELLAYDDDDNEINRCVVEQWIENKDDDFYQHVAATLRSSLHKQKEKIEQMSILKPYSFVLEDDDKETIEELYLVDDDTVILHEELMAGLDKDLDEFLEQLLKD